MCLIIPNIFEKQVENVSISIKRIASFGIHKIPNKVLPQFSGKYALFTINAEVICLSWHASI